MKYNFDEIIPRRGTSCVKHDILNKVFGSDDVISMWVADMDFKSPDFVFDAIKKRCEHEVLGYTFGSDSYYDTLINWFDTHYSLKVERQQLHFIPGIVAGISFVLLAFTNLGDSVLIMNPVYPPFINLPQKNGRKLSISRLNIENGRFAIDFDDLDKKARGCKLMILSNPHNPGGTVWTAEELRKIAEICNRHGVLVISDEIHADLTLPAFKHVSFASVSEVARNNSITFIAPSKTFSIAGLSSSASCIFDATIRDKFYGFLDNTEIANGNIFAYTGAEAAFKYGEEWRLQMLDYLQGNIDFVKDYLKEQLPWLKAVMPEASYLIWLDFNATGLSHQELKEKLVKEAKVGINSGLDFGDGYDGFFRMNVGCPRAVIRQALENIKLTF
ncbi:MAG: pyridoxal phosphate-dependent aminotransferase [Bacteroidales bacterium]|nr:pyridoxal phosphate-dependent aminotransferase [Bacteroidales bacterium]